MPKDTTEKKERKERKEKKEKKEKRKKEVVQDSPAEAPTTDVPEDVEMENTEVTKVDFPRPSTWFRPIGLTHTTGNEETKEREEGRARGDRHPSR